MNPWSEEELVGIKVDAVDECDPPASIFDGSGGYVEFSIAGNDESGYTITHEACVDGTSELRYTVDNDSEKFTTSAFSAEAFDEATHGNTFDAV